MVNFQDIFSKKKEKPEVKTEIIVDFREKNSLVPAELISKGFEPKFEQLQIGDYLIKNVCIERKTYQDLISSMINKRIFSQLNDLKKYKEHFLIIEGKPNFEIIEKTNLDRAAKGLIISIASDYQVPTLFSSSPGETAEFLILIAKRQTKNKVKISLRLSKSSRTLEEQKQFLLEGFPGIGPTLSEKLLKSFRNLKEIFNAPKEKLSEIKGFDENKLKKFLEILEG
jgi:ERCC4-type nuclease